VSLPEERAARNEVLFRDVNEQVDRLSGRLVESAEVDLVCECSDDACIERLEVPRDVYASVRSNPRRFIVARGHESDVERVVDRAPSWTIVEKTGAAGRIAEESRPRR
jgi:hypothetical protein